MSFTTAAGNDIISIFSVEYGDNRMGGIVFQARYKHLYVSQIWGLTWKSCYISRGSDLDDNGLQSA